MKNGSMMDSSSSSYLLVNLGGGEESELTVYSLNSDAIMSLNVQLDKSCLFWNYVQSDAFYTSYAYLFNALQFFVVKEFKK